MQTAGESPADGGSEPRPNFAEQSNETSDVSPEPESKDCRTPATGGTEALRGPAAVPPSSVIVFLPGQDLERVTTGNKAEAQRRRELLAEWKLLEAEGYTRKQAAKKLGVGHVTLWRLENGTTPLDPKWHNCGRSGDWEYLLKDEKFTAKLDELYLATIGASCAPMTARRRTAKMSLALTSIADEPECPAELALKLRRGKFPVYLMRYLRRVTPELENRIRGPKHFQLNGLVSRRDQTVRFADGTRADMPAGFRWVFDDMSANQPFFVLTPDLEILFSRQGLYCLDHRSLRWLGKMLVARPREAYRAEDILRFLRKLFQIYGKPDMITFEQSVWKARKIHGFKIGAGGPLGSQIELDEYERPEMDERERANLSAGLAAIGVEVQFAKSAHGKIIEVCFNHLQNVLAIKARQFLNIGRHAGEFEMPAKRLRQVRAGVHEPGRLGFAEMAELSDCIDAAFIHINGKVNSRGEVPDEIWSRDLEARPLPPLAQRDLAAFLPDLREVRILGGRVTAIVDGVPNDFRAEWMANLGDNYLVYCRFDTSEPTLGAAIYNRDHSSANHRLDDVGASYQEGELIGFAAWEMPAPAADWSGPVPRGMEARPAEAFYPGAIDQGDTIRRKQSKQVATLFSALPRPGQPAVRTVEHRDGRGGLVRVERGAGGEETKTGAVAKPQPTTRRTRAAGVSQDHFERQSARLEREEQRAAALAAGTTGEVNHASEE